MATPFDDMVFGFPEDFEESPENSCDSEGSKYFDIEDEVEEKPCNVEEKKAFWETQNQLLQSTLYKSNSIEKKVRDDTKEVLDDMVGVQCLCRSQVTGACWNCLRNEVCKSLRNRGHDCTICKSKWRRSPDIPSGEFEMARASKEYNQLIGILPEVYVGKSERLKEVIKILCKAAKKCMKEKKIHLGPWRKQKYMQAKWFCISERTTHTLLHENDRQPKPKASMLTVDLLGTLCNSHLATIKVV